MCYFVSCSCVIGFLTLFLLFHRPVCGEVVLHSEGTRMLNELLTPMGVNEVCLKSHYSHLHCRHLPRCFMPMSNSSCIHK